MIIIEQGVKIWKEAVVNCLKVLRKSFTWRLWYEPR